MERGDQVVAVDLHGVLTTKSPHTRAEMAATFDVSEDVWDAVFEQVFGHHHAWDRLERAEIDTLEYHAIMASALKRYGVTCTLEAALSVWRAPDPFTSAAADPDVVSWVGELRQQTTTCLATNNIAAWRQIWRQLIEVDVLFDHVFDSSEVGHRKPSTGFWRHVEEHTTGTRFILVDDNEDNVEGALAAGWAAVLHSDAELTRHAVEDWLHA